MNQHSLKQATCVYVRYDGRGVMLFTVNGLWEYIFYSRQCSYREYVNLIKKKYGSVLATSRAFNGKHFLFAPDRTPVIFNRYHYIPNIVNPFYKGGR